MRVERDKESLTMHAAVADGARVVLEPRQFGPAATEPTRRRGDEQQSHYAVSGRNRIEVLSGMWRSGDSGATVTTGNSALDVFAGLQ